MRLSVKKHQLFALLAIGMLLYSSAYAQFYEAGQLDTTFNFGLPHSYFVNHFGTNGTGHGKTINSVVRQADGKYVHGCFSSSTSQPADPLVVRVLHDGGIDTSFNIGGVGPDESVSCLALQADGKILVGGGFRNFNGRPSRGIVRLNTDGSLDTSFASLTSASFLRVAEIVVQPDGKILIAGTLPNINGSTMNNLVRLDSNGNLDVAFNANLVSGQVIEDVKLQSDGKILLGGLFSNINGIPRQNLARLHSNGSVDTSFNTAMGANSYITDMAIQADGKIIVGGLFTTYAGMGRGRIARVNADGSLDASFFPGIGFNNPVNRVVLHTNGSILVVGSFTAFNGISAPRISCLDQQGRRDTSFNVVIGPNNEIYDLLVEPGGKIMLGGLFTIFNNQVRRKQARLLPNGDLDYTFLPVSGTSTSSTTSAVVQQPDGKILVGGVFSNYCEIPRKNIVRINPDGTPDLSFNPGSGADFGVNTIVVQPDGKIIIAGMFTQYNGIPRNRIARLNANGSLDTTFNPGSGTDNWIHHVVLDAQGRILIGGRFFDFNGVSRYLIARLNSDGSLDTTFKTVTVGVPGAIIRSVNLITLQGDGKIIISGDFDNFEGSNRKHIARLHPNGQVDTTFGIPRPDLRRCFTSALQGDGKILVAYNSIDPNSGSESGIMRLNADGSIDTTYSTSTLTRNGSTIKTIVILPTGKAIIGGELLFNASSRQEFVAILNVDGTRDTSFSSRLSSAVNAMYWQPDGKLIVAGTFNSFDGFIRNGVARIFAPSCTAAVTNTTVATTICMGDTKSLVGTPGGSWTIAYGPGQITGNTYIAIGGGGTVILYNRVGSCYSPLVTFNVDFPAAPQLRDTAVCAGSAGIAVTLTPLAGGTTYRFYADSTTTSPLAGGNYVNSFTTPILTSTTTFYVSAVSASGCEGSARRAVTVRVNALPIVSISRNADTLVATTALGDYQWFKDGNAIVGATTSSHRVVESGVYTVTLTSPEGCATTSNAITMDVTSVEDVGNSVTLRWNSYPVPFSSELILQAEAAFGYQLLDIRGAVLIQGQSEGTQATLNTSELASGIYFVRIAVNGQIAFRKLVKE